jgi:predicted phosphohydrolase
MAYLIYDNLSSKIYYNLKNLSGIVQEKPGKKVLHFGNLKYYIYTKTPIEKILEKIDYINNSYEFISDNEFLEHIKE